VFHGTGVTHGTMWNTIIVKKINLKYILVPAEGNLECCLKIGYLTCGQRGDLHPLKIILQCQRDADRRFGSSGTFEPAAGNIGVLLF